MTDLKSLIAELEQAKEGSRELSDKVLLACGWRYEKIADGVGFSGKPRQQDTWIDPTGVPWTRSVKSKRPSPTESLDDAMTLVLECSYIDMTIEPVREDCDRVCLAVIRIDNDTRFSGTSTTPALTLCIAALKARIEAAP